MIIGTAGVEPGPAVYTSSQSYMTSVMIYPDITEAAAFE